MLIYIVMILVIVLLGIIIFRKENNEKNRKIFLILSFLILFFIMGFREINVGTDTKQYCYIFSQRSSQSLKQIISIGEFSIWGIYNKFLSLFSSNVHTIIIVNSALILSLTALFIYKNTDHVVYSTLLFILFYHYFSAFNISRQYISIMILANAFSCLKNKRLGKYVLMCILATLIHNTAIISFALIPFIYLKINKKRIITYIALLTILIMMFSTLMEVFANIFPHYKIYLEGQYIISGNNGYLLIILVYFIISVLAYITIDKNKEDREFTLLSIMNVLAILTSILSLKISIIARISLYFTIYVIVLVPNVFDRIKNNKIVYLLFFMIMLIPLFVRLNGNNSGILPYSNYLLTII